MAQSRISDLTAGTPPVPANSLFEISVVNAASPSGYDSRRFTLSDIFGSYFPLGPTLGGTGVTTYAQGDLLFASATNVLSKLPKNTAVTRYLSNTGTNNAPAWGQINLANGVSGLLPVTAGGTGSSNFPIPLPSWSLDGTLLRGSGTNAVSSTSSATSVLGMWGNAEIAMVNAGTGEPGIDFGRSRGTIAAPSAVQSGDPIGSLWFDGYGATRWHGGSTAILSAVATQNFTDTAQGSSFHFMVTPNGTVSIQDIMQLDGRGLHLSNNISVVDAIPAAASIGTITSHHLTSFELNFNIFATETDPIIQNIGWGSNLWFDTEAGTLWYSTIPNRGVGTQVPWTDCQSPLSLNADAVLHISHTGYSSYSGGGGYTVPGSLLLSYANGTAAAPSAVTNGQWIGMIGFTGYAATKWQLDAWSLYLAGVASENWTDTANGTRFEVWATPNGMTGNSVTDPSAVFADNGDFYIKGSYMFQGTPAGTYLSCDTSGNLSWVISGAPYIVARTYDWLFYSNKGGMAGYGPYTNISDLRAKEQESVKPSSYGLDTILKLDPIEFIRLPKDDIALPKEIGFVAQQVHEVLPEAVRAVGIELPDGTGGLDDDEPTLGITYDTIVAVLVNAVKQLESRVKLLEGKS